MDANGEEILHHLVERFTERSHTMVFCELRPTMLSAMRRSGLIDLIGPQHIFSAELEALVAIYGWLEGSLTEEGNCPLLPQFASS